MSGMNGDVSATTHNNLNIHGSTYTSKNKSCVICGSVNNLDKHHIWGMNHGMYVFLCVPHHQEFHNYEESFFRKYCGRKWYADYRAVNRSYRGELWFEWKGLKEKEKVN
jgi:hypothetical protein